MKAAVVPTVSLLTAQSPQGQGPGSAPVAPVTGPRIEALGQVFEGAGSAAFRMGQILRARVDRADANVALARFSDAARQALMSPEGYLAKIGGAAADPEARQNAIDALTEEREKIAGSLRTPEARRLFAERVGVPYQSALTRIDSHFIGQTRAHDLAGLKSLAETEAREMVDDFFTGGEGAFEARHARLFGSDGTLSQLARLQGMHPDAAALERQKALDGVYGAVVARQAKTDPIGAQVSLDRFKEQGYLSGMQTAELQERVTAEGVKKRAHDSMTAIRALGGDLQQQMAAVDERIQSKKLDVDAGLAALDMLIQRARVDENKLAKQKLEVWDDITATIQADEPLTAEQEDKLKRTGQLDRFNRWMKSDQRHVNSDQGRRMLATINGAELRRDFDSEEAVYDHFIDHMAPEMAQSMVVRWQKAAPEPPDPAKLAQLIDEAALLDEGYREHAGLSDTDEIPAPAMNRWESTVRRNLLTLMGKANKEYPTDDLWREAMRLAASDRLYHSREEAETGEGGVPAAAIAPSAIRTGGVFQRLPSGEVVELKLQHTLVRGDTTRNAVLIDFAEQMAVDEPEKPLGFVRLGDRVVHGSELTMEHVLVAEDALRTDDERARHERGTDVIRKIYHKELQSIMRKAVLEARADRARLRSLTEDDPTAWLRTRYKPLPEWIQAPTQWAHEAAMERVFARQREWDGFYLQEDDVREILKWKPSVTPPMADIEGFDPQAAYEQELRARYERAQWRKTQEARTRGK